MLWYVLSGLSTCSREWDFNSAFFLLLRSLARPFSSDPALVARVAGALAILAGAVWFWRRDDGEAASFPHIASYMLGTLILFSPTVMPWYLVLLLPPSVLCHATVWSWFTAAGCLTFFVMVNGTLWTPVLVL